MNTPVVRRARAVQRFAAACAVLLVAGCSASTDAADGGESASDRTTTAAAATTARPKAVAEDVTDIEHPPGEGVFAGALDDIKVTDCAAADGGWRVAGTATNSTSDTADYRIFVSLMAADEVAALVEVQVDEVAAGTSKPFERLVKVDAKALKCVLRVERRVHS